VTSAFISYAHEDEEFMLALVEPLRDQGLDIRYDKVVLRVGDSLIERLADEIADGDFLIAIVSPGSVQSSWCQRELAIAETQGISGRRVKVLPVKFRGATMPPVLEGIFYMDADQNSVEGVALKLAEDMRARLGGEDDVSAARRAAEVEDVGGAPPHAERADDVGVAQIEEVAQRAMDVLAAWAGVYDRGNVRDLNDPQRRLRWAFDVLPDRVRAALPLVQQLATAAWDELFGFEARGD
jgi:hypothetical protein